MDAQCLERLKRSIFSSVEFIRRQRYHSVSLGAVQHFQQLLAVKQLIPLRLHCGISSRWLRETGEPVSSSGVCHYPLCDRSCNVTDLRHQGFRFKYGAVAVVSGGSDL
jgi:hypothetical protein